MLCRKVLGRGFDSRRLHQFVIEKPLSYKGFFLLTSLDFRSPNVLPHKLLVLLVSDQSQLTPTTPPNKPGGGAEPYSNKAIYQDGVSFEESGMISGGERLFA